MLNQNLIDRLMHVYGNDVRSIRNAVKGIRNTFEEGGPEPSEDIVIPDLSNGITPIDLATDIMKQYAAEDLKKESAINIDRYVNSRYDWTEDDFKNITKMFESRSRVAYPDLRYGIDGGYGHQMTPDEVKRYWDGKKAIGTIPDDVIDKWFDSDWASKKANVAKYYPDADDYIQNLLTAMAYQGGDKLIRAERDSKGNPMYIKGTKYSPFFELAMNKFIQNPSKQNMQAVIDQMQYAQDGDKNLSGLSNRYGLYRAILDGTADPKAVMNDSTVYQGYRSNKFDEGGIENLVNRTNRLSNANFIKRLNDANRMFIKDWEDPDNSISTHKMAYVTDDEGNAIIYPNVQQMGDSLVDFTRPPYHPYVGFNNAVINGDTIMTTPIIADEYTNAYKNYYQFGK